MDQTDELCFGILGGVEKGTRTVQSGHNIIHTHFIKTSSLPHFGLSIPYLPVYKSTFFYLKIGPKNRPRLIHGSKFSTQAPVK